MHTVDAEKDCILIDDRLVRANATITTIVLTLTLLCPRPITLILLALQALVFSSGIWLPKWNPYPKISRFLVLTKLFKQGDGEHPKPIRFSQEVGLCFILPAFLLLSFGVSWGLALVAFCLFASALNAFAGVCLACLMYPRLNILRHKFYHLFSIQIR